VSLPSWSVDAHYPDRVEILLWLVPPMVVTCLAMAWVSWVSREGAGEVDREAQAERFAAAMARQLPGRQTQAPARPRDRSTGIAVRPSRTTDPAARRSA
jgi:hypothetical protein